MRSLRLRSTGSRALLGSKRNELGIPYSKSRVYGCLYQREEESNRLEDLEGVPGVDVFVEDVHYDLWDRVEVEEG
jgi:hypothetical protein